jgi:sulfatase modifying factor 1
VSRWSWVLIVIVALVLALVAGRALYVQICKPRLIGIGETAAAAGRWTEALAALRKVTELDPGDRVARDRFDDVLRLAVVAVAGSEAAPRGATPHAPGGAGGDVGAARDLLRWLVGAAEWTALADLLDRSMVTVPAGPFIMGSDNDRPDERPQRSVFLDAYRIDRYEVANAQYRRYLVATGQLAPPYWSGSQFPAGGGAYPVVGVSWSEAAAYCAWAGKRLPTEAEWEKACRGTDGRRYPWGNAWDPDMANVDVSTHRERPVGGELQPWDEAWQILRAVRQCTAAPHLCPVGFYPAGASPPVGGMMDAAGNASEWVEDWYNWEGYQELPDRNPVVTGPPWNRSLRGSAWYDPHGAAGWAEDLSRCSARNSSHETRDPRVGFRCAGSVQEETSRQGNK